MRFASLKRMVFTLFALCMVCACCLFVRGAYVCKLREIEGRRCFYLHSPSAWAERKERLGLQDIPHVQGESVHFSFQGTHEQTLALVLEILKSYQAEIVCVEEACGVVSYYAHAPCLYTSVALEGKQVNLHIAIGEGRAAVGSPMIFGGF